MGRDTGQCPHCTVDKANEQPQDIPILNNQGSRGGKRPQQMGGPCSPKLRWRKAISGGSYHRPLHVSVSALENQNLGSERRYSLVLD